MKAPTNTVRNVIALMLLISFQLVISALFQFEVPETNRDMVTYMLGQLSGMATTVLAFHFNTTQGSVDKNNTIAHLAEAPKDVKVMNTSDDPIPTTSSGETDL